MPLRLASVGCAQQERRVPSCFGSMAASSASAGGLGGRLRLTPLQYFTKFFEQFGLPVPLIDESWESDGQCYIRQINGEYMENPSLTSRRVAAARRCSVPGIERLPDARPLPDTFYHGTSVEGLQGILFRGRFATAAELGRRQHRPDGVYAYASVRVSDQSTYVEQGCQVAFKAVAYGTSLNASRAAASVPEGVAMVMARSAHRRHGCEGFEWVLHPKVVSWSTCASPCRNGLPSWNVRNVQPLDLRKLQIQTLSLTCLP